MYIEIGGSRGAKSLRCCFCAEVPTFPGDVIIDDSEALWLSECYWAWQRYMSPWPFVCSSPHRRTDCNETLTETDESKINLHSRELTYPFKVAGKRIFLFHRWDMLVARKVDLCAEKNRAFARANRQVLWRGFSSTSVRSWDKKGLLKMDISPKLGFFKYKFHCFSQFQAVLFLVLVKVRILRYAPISD